MAKMLQKKCCSATKVIKINEATLNVWELRSYGVQIRLTNIDQNRPYMGFTVDLVKDRVLIKEGTKVYKDKDLEWFEKLVVHLLNTYRVDGWETIRNSIEKKLLNQ